VTLEGPVHPVDSLTPERKYRIYYHRVVDLSVASGLLTDDPDTEIGHFAFSSYYQEGGILDEKLGETIARFEDVYPKIAVRRSTRRNRELMGAVERFHASSVEEKIADLIRVGASRKVWPLGTSFTLTYPWDLTGKGRPVRFRDDLTDFMKRRIIKILEETGKLRSSDPFRT